MIDDKVTKIEEGSKKIFIHIDYTEEPQLKELIELLACINKGYNDVIRKNKKVSNNKIGEYAPKIEMVDRGSINIFLNVNILVSTTLAIIIVNSITKRINISFKKSKKYTEFHLEIKIGKGKFKFDYVNNK
jgi:hypothetical protein